MYIIQNMAFLWRGQLDLLKIGFFLSIPMYILIIWREKYWFMEKSIVVTSEGLWGGQSWLFANIIWRRHFISKQFCLPLCKKEAETLNPSRTILWHHFWANLSVFGQKSPIWRPGGRQISPGRQFGDFFQKKFFLLKIA